ncbi:IclR family transcriptional regulator [Vibrio mediterranei]
MAKNLSLIKAFDVIDAVADGCKTLKDISEKTGVPNTTVHRILSGLIEARYVRNIDGIGITLSTKLIQLGARALETMPLKDVARPLLIELVRETQETVHLGIRDEDEVFYLDKVAGNRAIQLSSRIGDRQPMILTGIGKALMLDLPMTEIHRLVKVYAPSSKDEFVARIQDYQEKGYAFDLEDNEDLVHCVAVPIRGKHGKIIAALSITSIKEYLPMGRMLELVPKLNHYASKIEELL